MIWQEKKISTTFLFFFKEEIIGFFCCSGDSIRLGGKEKKTGKLDGKPIPEFPAIKIGRLGRDKKIKGKKIGEEILKWAIGYIQELSKRIGVRFITVDAYPNKVSWYEQFGFVKNLHRQYDKKTHVSMRYDLYNPPKK